MILQKNDTNIYYTLQAIETNNLSNLKYRMLKNRLKLLLSTKAIEIGNTIFKQSNKWFIHYSIIDQFQAIRVHSKSKVRADKYKNEITINLPSNYDEKFYHFLAYKIKQQLQPSKMIYSIETSPKTDSKYHLHIGTTAPLHRITQKLKEIERLTQLPILANANTMIAPIRNLTQFVNYIAKANQNLVTELKENTTHNQLVYS